MSVRCDVTVGVGGWAFLVTLDLPVCPIPGQLVGPDGDTSPVYVSTVTVTPGRVYVDCPTRFASEDGMREMETAWREALAPKRRRR